jgi:hypothetical protein
MRAGTVLDLAALIVGVALVTTVVSHPASSQVIGAIGGAFTNSLKAAMGR